MDCNSPAQAATAPHGLKHPSTDRNTPARAETTSLSGCLSHHVLNKPVTSLWGGWGGGETCPPAAPKLEGEPSSVERSPSKRPRRHPLRSAGNWCLGEGRALLASLRSGPCSSGRGRTRHRRCHGGRGGNRTFPTVAARRHFCPQPCHLPWVPATHPHQSAQFGLARTFRSRALQRYRRPRPVSSPRAEGRCREAVLHPAAMSCPLCSGEQEVTEVLGRMR